MELSIRSTEPEDYTALQQLYSGQSVRAGTLQLPFPSVEMWRKRLAEPREGHYSLVACHDQLIVGQVGLDTFPLRPRRRHAGDIGMAVHEQWQGKGVGTTLMQAIIDLADNWLNLLRLELTVYTDNAPAVHLYQKFGFEIEGTLRGYAFRNGVLVDAYSMARLKGQQK